MTFAFTYSTKDRTVDGQKRRVIGKMDITAIGSGTGEDVSGGTNARKFGLSQRVDSIRPLGPTDNGYMLRWDGDNTKVRAFRVGNSGLTATYTPTDGDAIVTEYWGNIKGAKFANQVASGAAATNGAYVHALAAATAALVNAALTNPDFPRNLVVSLESAGGGALPADCGTCTINGTDKDGNALQEIISLAPLNGVVLGAGGLVYVVGTRCFATVTDYQLSVDITATLADARASVGIGTKLALKKTMDPASEAAIQRVFKNDAAIAAATYVGDGAVNAVDLGADIADNDDILVQYTTDSDAAGGSVAMGGNAVVNSEAANGADVGEAWVEVVGI